jgi:hypothetical protein
MILRERAAGQGEFRGCDPGKNIVKNTQDTLDMGKKKIIFNMLKKLPISNFERDFGKKLIFFS